ncbi:Uma2 family endonuclease [Thermoflexibacter ruber]|uniref:Endonuclease, Uma2 family (Restriction endonuclease fold) n=1 Tax=Thermoflexibacter ruber TaxID=1003 RepID=A0A1I2ELE6_9BACT|nr:Uma2 family endonuclease [Thermoflexibacter ruber]SFE93914.1 Endonuclease, Uma2 family (restriction endonuclease fold) [Thermoflexibacter ruber]
MQTEEISIDMPSLYHSVVQSNLAALFYIGYGTEYRALTQPTLLLNDWESEPDLAIFPKRPLNWVLDEIRITEIPLCIIEIISPRQGTQEIKEKFVKYFEAGVPSCWLINPLMETVQIYSSDWQHKSFSKEHTYIQDSSINVSIEFAKIFS